MKLPARLLGLVVGVAAPLVVGCAADTETGTTESAVTVQQPGPEPKPDPSAQPQPAQEPAAPANNPAPSLTEGTDAGPPVDYCPPCGMG